MRFFSVEKKGRGARVGMDGRGVRNPECRDGEPVTNPVRVDGVGE